MAQRSKDASGYVPGGHCLPVLRKAVQQGRGCDLYHQATQAVFGEIEAGSKLTEPHARLMMVGEQPGDKEDLAGRPFVGPAGKLLDHCLVEAGIERAAVYVTNAVKHFKWEPRGKIRLHKKPSLTEVKACKPWLDAEIDAIRPAFIVCLGATAAQSLLGSKFRITASRGKVQRVDGYPPIVATVHPASILRAITEEDKHRETAAFINDLRHVAQLLQAAQAS